MAKITVCGEDMVKPRPDGRIVLRRQDYFRFFQDQNMSLTLVPLNRPCRDTVDIEIRIDITTGYRKPTVDEFMAT